MAAVGAGSSSTTTITVEEGPQQHQHQQVLKLRLAPRRNKKKVTWKEGTINNEFMNKKSSKKCCIFQKQKSFDEDDSDEDGDLKNPSKKGKGISDDSASCDHGESSVSNGHNSCSHSH